MRTSKFWPDCSRGGLEMRAVGLGFGEVERVRERAPDALDAGLRGLGLRAAMGSKLTARGDKVP